MSCQSSHHKLVTVRLHASLHTNSFTVSHGHHRWTWRASRKTALLRIKLASISRFTSLNFFKLSRRLVEAVVTTHRVLAVDLLFEFLPLLPVVPRPRPRPRPLPSPRPRPRPSPLDVINAELRGSGAHALNIKP